MAILAYIDPGSGSLIIQVVLAAILTVPFVLRSKLREGVRRIRGVGRARTASPEDPPAREA